MACKINFLYEIGIVVSQLLQFYVEVNSPGTTHIVTQTSTLLSAAMRMLRLHLVLEKLIFSIYLLPYVFKKNSWYRIIL